MAFFDFLWETTKPTIDIIENKLAALPFKRKQFQRHSGTHVKMCCILILKQHTAPCRSALQLTFSPEWNSKLPEFSISKSGETYSQHTLRWQHFPWYSQTKNSSSSGKLTMKMRPNNKPLEGKNNLGQTQKIGYQIRKHLH